MSTRSRRKAALTSKTGSEPLTAAKAKVRSHGAKSAQADDMDVEPSVNGKENLKSSAVKQGKKDRSKKKLLDLDCVCSKGNDGSPMVYCASCRIWYHFTCVDLTEPEAEEISVYICPTCTSSCGRHTALVWEGDGAIEEESDDESAIAYRRKLALNAHKTTPDLKEESEDEESSEDEYLERDKEVRVKQEQRNRRLRRLSTPSDSESPDESARRRLRRGKVSPSPSPSVSGQLKRKSAHSNLVQSSPPPSKRKKSGSRHESQSPADDPARKYCLGKLEELFRDIYLRYPHTTDADGKIMAKKLEELTDEQKDALVNESRQFAAELESCVFEIYSEPDKAGQPHAGGKYKDRFRMLQFNLSKVDRVNIHRRITSGDISPKEISLMSSTDLADEETKQSIILAEKEALEYSILLKSTAPRAKITHKGLQDIEDVNGEVASAYEIELHREREQADEERRERERMARLRVQRQRTASMSAPPESPAVQQSPTSAEPTWGGPPPVPAHAMSPKAVGSDEFIGGISRLPQTSEENAAEPELNLADLINIDDDETSTSSANVQSQVASMSIASPTDASFPPAPLTMPTGISPFAARPDKRGASFDLNALWSAPKEEPLPTESSVSAVALAEEPSAEGSDKDDAMELESVDEANDQDFDMFLEDKEEKPQKAIDQFSVTPIISKDVESLSTVWTGKITMPLDSSVPQETSLVARQVAGRPLAPNSVLWKTLFPSDQLRIEGRVPVENSIKYLLQMRLNAAKELYAAAFVPASLTHEEDFKIFCNFLISKGRHGLVFPWGSRPKEYHPGRELYMIPLLQSEPLPEFVQLLDELKLPETRSRDYLIGIWILNKGKLAPLPGVSTQSATPPTIANQPPQPAQPLQLPPPTQTPPLNVPAYNPSPPIPQIPQGIPNLPPAVPGLPIAPAALAAEVASLTPEQLQEVLRTLASTTQIALPPLPQPPPALPHPPFLPNRPPPHMQNPAIGQHAPQAWMQHPPPPPFPISFPPSNVPNFQQPPPQGINPPRPPSHPPYDREYDRDRDYDREFRPGPHYSQSEHGHRGERGWRGNTNAQRGGGRGGRGRGRSDSQDFSARRDSGWPRRSRNEGQGGGPNW